MASIKGIAEIIAGAAIDAGLIALTLMFPGSSLNVLGQALFSVGSSLILAGIGTLITGTPVKGFATMVRNSTAAWRIAYGRVRVGGSIVFLDKDRPPSALSAGGGGGA